MTPSNSSVSMQMSMQISRKKFPKKMLKEETETLTDVFHKALSNDKLEVKVEKLKNAYCLFDDCSV